MSNRINQRGLLVGLAAALIIVGGGLAWKFILRPDSVVDLPRATNSLGMEFVQIPAGHFIMGSPENEQGRDEEAALHQRGHEDEVKLLKRDDDEDEHEVEITRPFFLGVHEVTQEQFHSVMGPNPLVFIPGRELNPNLPVENVTHGEAVRFCEKLSELPAEKMARRRYRLPAEAEWEYACRAGAKGKPFAFGPALAPDQANSHMSFLIRENQRGEKEKRTRKPQEAFTTEPVGSYKPNAWGLFDMHGNVWEWCADRYAADYYQSSPKQDPTGPVAGEQFVARGGSWASKSFDCRSANRLAVAPDVRLGMGLRVVMVQEGK